MAVPRPATRCIPGRRRAASCQAVNPPRMQRKNQPYDDQRPEARNVAPRRSVAFFLVHLPHSWTHIRARKVCAILGSAVPALLYTTAPLKEVCLCCFLRISIVLYVDINFQLYSLWGNWNNKTIFYLKSLSSLFFRRLTTCHYRNGLWLGFSYYNCTWLKST